LKTEFSECKEGREEASSYMLDRKTYQKAYSDALEHILVIFNRLYLKGKLREECKNCKLVKEIEKLRLLIKDREYKQIEQEIGYMLV